MYAQAGMEMIPSSVVAVTRSAAYSLSIPMPRARIKQFTAFGIALSITVT